MIVALSGTPGVGKTYVAKKIFKTLGWEHIELGKIIKQKKLYSKYDKKMKSYVVDMKKFKAYFAKLKGDIILDGHLSHELSKNLVDKVIVLRCEPKVLEKRLKSRKYSKEKIKQNFEAELIGLISWEARQKHKTVIDVDCTKGKVKCVKKVIFAIRSKSKKANVIDWCAK
jgi:adenylate kinase